MKVSTSEPFKVIYAYLEHEYLGYLIEPYAIQLDQSGKLTLKHQHISSKNMKEFAKELDETDFKLIKLADEISQEYVMKRHTEKGAKKATPQEFFTKIFNKDKGLPIVQEMIILEIENRVNQMMTMMVDKPFFEMGNDGEPTWKEIQVLPEKASVLFHFMRNETNTHYFPTIKYNGEKVDFQYKNAILLCKHPAWLVVDDKVFTFKKAVDGQKLKPFLRKKFIEVPKKLEDTYFEKFVAPLVASFDVHAKGFEIRKEPTSIPSPIISLNELATVKNASLFEDDKIDVIEANEHKIIASLSFKYGAYEFNGNNLQPCFVKIEKTKDSYIFHKVERAIDNEKDIIKTLKSLGLEIKNGKYQGSANEVFSWVIRHKKDLEEKGILIKQNKEGKKYFIGNSSFNIEVKDGNDWFDINATIKFGDYDIPFKSIRKYILKGQTEFNLPNGEIAIIPEEWFSQYTEFFAFINEGTDNLTLEKHHITLVQELQKGNLAKVNINGKLEKLKNFDTIDDIPLPNKFNGKLRPYQKAGYNWMLFLNKYKLGGCLADDMGLGKSVQTLAMIQNQKENNASGPSLLIVPTSLIYNWLNESEKFTPELKIFNYSGVYRNKDVSQFNDYDLIITSYGTCRRDIDLLSNFYFNYVILDESQAIKNPDSNISHAVKQLKCAHKLILTGTPIENSTLDLWSQMSFVNPGMLGSESFFKKEFQLPIEKKQDEVKKEKLYKLIKPFILRRHKSQVATELPEKVENIQFCHMTHDQEKYYEDIKSQYRNKLMEHIDEAGNMKGTELLLLQGLTKLRQIANHPYMVDDSYNHHSGKMDDIIHMLHNALTDDHKILIFSSFVKHLQIFKKYLEKHKINFSYLDGSTKNREAEVEKFQNNKNVSVFLISIKAGGTGLNLTAADYVFILDPWWNPAVEQQAIDRAYRIGQTNKVFTYKFITKNTVEEKILNMQKGKLKLAGDLISTEESFVKNLSKDDIVSIFD